MMMTLGMQDEEVVGVHNYTIDCISNDSDM